MTEYEYFRIVKGSSTPYPVHRRDKKSGIVSYYDTLQMEWDSCRKYESVQDFIDTLMTLEFVTMTEEEVDSYIVQSELEK